MSLCVIIPSKTASNLLPCIDAISRNEPGMPIVVIDDGLEFFASQWLDMKPPVRIIKGEKPFIFSRNINAGVRHAIELDPSVEGFVLCNDDCLLESPRGFTILYEAWKQNPQYGIIGAVTDLTGQPLQHRRDIGLRAVPHIAFVCCFVPRSTFENVQWMDPAYCIDYGVEDRDLCEAVNRAGLLVGVHDECFVNHSSLHSSFRGDPKTPRSFQKNYAYFKSKWGIIE